MIAATSQPFIRAVAQSYDAWANPEQHAQMIAQSQNLSPKDLENTREIPQEIENLLPHDLRTMVTAQAATMEDWILLSSIFSPEGREADVDLSAMEKLGSLLEVVKKKLAEIPENLSFFHPDYQKKAALQGLKEELEGRNKEIEALLQRTFADPKQRKVVLQKHLNLVKSQTQGAVFLSTPKTELLKHIFVQSFTHATEEQKGRIIEAAKALHPLLDAQLPWLEKATDRLWKHDNIKQRVTLFAISAILLCVCHAYLLYYLVRTLLAPWIIHTLAPMLFSSSYCPVLAAKVGQAVVAAFAWILNHKKYQMLFGLALGGFARLFSQKIPNARAHAFIEKCHQIVNYCLPFNLAFSHGFFFPFARIVSRIIVDFGPDGTAMKFHCTRSDQVPDAVRSQRFREGCEALQLWIGLAEHMEKERAKKAAAIRA